MDKPAIVVYATGYRNNEINVKMLYWHYGAIIFWVIYSLATKGRRMLSFALSGEWCSVLPLVFAQALVP
jgi:hypothetical protein